jgi:hypothetical protein
MKHLFALLLCPLSSGCLAFGFPSVTATPAVAVDAADVRAFRVTYDSLSGGALIAGWVQIGDQIEEIPVHEMRVESQADASFCYLYMLPPFAGGHGRSVRVLLYRPGYETVEVPPRPWWQFPSAAAPERVTWKEAVDLAAEVRAVDELVEKGRLRWPCSNAAVLGFVAQEYERLGQTAVTADPAIRKHVDDKLAEVSQRLEQIQKVE